jgi:hypothetical protein
LGTERNAQQGDHKVEQFIRTPFYSSASEHMWITLFDPQTELATVIRDFIGDDFEFARALLTSVDFFSPGCYAVEWLHDTHYLAQTLFEHYLDQSEDEEETRQLHNLIDTQYWAAHGRDDGGGDSD